LDSIQENGQIISAENEDKIYEGIRAILAAARKNTINAINSAMVTAYWEIGSQISEAVGDRAEYCKRLLLFLSEKLTREFGKGFTERSLRHMRQFYQMFLIRNALRSELSWTHYRNDTPLDMARKIARETNIGTMIDNMSEEIENTSER